MKIGIVHAAVGAIQPLMEAFQELDPSVQIVNFVNEQLLDDVNRASCVEKKNLRNFGRLLFEAADSGVDGLIIACSVFCEYLSLFEKMVDIPVVAIDEPMLRKAVNSGKKIGIVATTAAAVHGSKKRMIEYAALSEKEIVIEEIIVTEGMTALRKGDVCLHDEIVENACQHLILNGCDNVILCQISMARAKTFMNKSISDKVLTSPQTGAEEILRLVKKSDY